MRNKRTPDCPLSRQFRTETSSKAVWTCQGLLRGGCRQAAAAKGPAPVRFAAPTSNYAAVETLLDTILVTSQQVQVTTALQVGFPYPTPWRKGCRDWNPDLLIEKVPILKATQGKMTEDNGMKAVRALFVALPGRDDWIRTGSRLSPGTVGTPGGHMIQKGMGEEISYPLWQEAGWCDPAEVSTIIWWS